MRMNHITSFGDFINESKSPVFDKVQKELKVSKKDLIIWAEMARRYLQFHKNEEFENIKLWGLFNWGQVSHLLKSGELITDMKKNNQTIWVRPSINAIELYIKPLIKYDIEVLYELAGW